VSQKYITEVLDLSPYIFSTAISGFRLRLCKNFSTYTPYMLQNFSFTSLEIRKFRHENYKAIGLLFTALQKEKNCGGKGNMNSTCGSVCKNRDNGKFGGLILLQ